MAINNIEERVERSIFEALRRALVTQGYLPDVTNAGRYPLDNQGNLTIPAETNWKTDLQLIKTTQGFAIELFGTSSVFAKGLKAVPRIVVIAKRILPGDIGLPMGSTYVPQLDGSFRAYNNPLESANMHLDIHLISGATKQSRILNGILQLALGQKKYIPFYDDLSEHFLVRNYNYFDVSDTNDSVEENVYSYEVQDLFPFDIDIDNTNETGNGRVIVAIKEINMDFVMGYKEITNPNGTTEIKPENPEETNTLKIT